MWYLLQFEKDMKINETIDLGENWFAVVISQIKWDSGDDHDTVIRVNHKCCETAVVHPVIKNTHRRYGIRYRCRNCKTYAPKRVLLFLKLHKLHERVS